MMRNFTYKIVVAIVVFISYAVGSNAQTPVPTVLVDLEQQPKNDFELVSTIDDGRATVYHAVSGTSVEFTLDDYDSNCIYSYERFSSEKEETRVNVDPTGGKFILKLTNDISNQDLVRYTYKFYASKDGQTWSSPFSMDFIVYKEPKIEEIKLIPSQKYHILGSDNEVNVQLEYTPSIYWGESGDFIDVAWLLVDNITDPNITDQVHDNKYVLPRDILSGKKDFYVTIKALAPNKTAVWVEEKINTSIQVYAEPEVSLTPASPYAIVGGAEIAVDVDLSGTDSELQGEESIKIKTDNWSGAVEQDGNELSASFNPSADGINTGQENSITTEVTWYYVEGSNKINLYTKELNDIQSGAASIMVYATPSVKLTPASPYAIVNGNAIDVRLDLDDVNDPSMQKPDEIQISATWTGADVNNDDKLSAKFNPAEKEANDYTITSEVKWYYKDGENELTLYRKNLENTKTGAAEITVYAEPTYILDTNGIYNSFVGVKIPIGTFINNNVSNDIINKNLELVVDNTSYKEPYTPVKPEAGKAFQLKAIYEYGGTTLYNKTKGYKINIIAAPVWDPNFDEIFGTNANGEADNYLYTTSELLSNCSKVIEVQQSNNSDVAIELSGKYSINDYNPTKFTVENSSLKSVPLSELCSSLNSDQENTIKFSFSYEVQNLLELEGNTDLKCKNETAYIYLCKEIDASLPDNPSLEFYTRVGDGKINDLKTDQISLTVVGGDPGLWKFELQDASGNNVLSDDDTETENESVTINIDYGRLKFTDEGVKVYQLYAKYVDGITKIGTNTPITINVYPEPKLNDLVVGLGNQTKSVTYKPKENDNYDITCYEGDWIKLSSSSNISNTSNTLSWKYKVGSNTDKQDITWDNNISFDSGDKIGTIEFYSYLNDSKERLVKTINLQVKYLSTPSVDFNHELRDAKNQEEANKLWNEATLKDNRLDLYAGWGKITLNFVPQGGYNEGWTRKLDGNDVSDEKGFDYELNDPTDSADGYEDKEISFTYKNSIPESGYQKGENKGIEETKNYYIRVWRKAELPEAIILKDVNNKNNKINENKAIREGNELILSVKEIKFGYNPNPQEEGSYNEYTLKENDREIEIDSKDPDTLKYVIGRVVNDKPDNGRESGKNTYELIVSNIGPRGGSWDENTIKEEITVYKRPLTPTSLVLKGSGTSGTLIITYDQLTEYPVQVPEDYYIVFRYPGCEDEIRKSPDYGNDRRWVATGTKITEADMKDAYAFSRLIHKVDGEDEKYVWISSGKITECGKKENWDCSEYNKTKEQTEEDRAITRAGGGDYTAIQSVESEEEMVSVYNTSGVKVATSTENLKPGIYIIRSMQNGEMNSKKLSVK